VSSLAFLSGAAIFHPQLKTKHSKIKTELSAEGAITKQPFTITAPDTIICILTVPIIQMLIDMLRPHMLPENAGGNLELRFRKV
jgi:hypothetical protein